MDAPELSSATPPSSLQSSPSSPLSSPPLPSPSPLPIEVLTDPVAVATRVSGLIERDPVACSVFATVLDGALRDGPDPGSVWLLAGDGDPVAAAVMTPPHDLRLTPVIGADPDAVVDALAGALLAAGIDPPGVGGPTGPATAFARAWRHRTGRDHTLRMRQPALVLTAPVDPAVAPGPVPGRARPAVEADLDLCLCWLADFQAEAMPGVPEPHGRQEAVRRRLARGGLTLWTDPPDRPVSLAGTSAVVAGVARIGPVYTPPEFRRHGYGAAVTAAASRAGFDAGARRCMLFTDATNPTSNALYRRLGYRPAGESVLYGFTGGPTR